MMATGVIIMSELAEWPRAPKRVPHILKSPAAVPGLIATFLVPFGVPISIGLFLYEVIEGRWLTGLIQFILTMAVIAGFVWFTVWLRRRQYAEVQEERDEFANAVADLLLQGHEPPPYSLYLRPFFTDGHLTADEGVARYLTFEADEIADIGQKRDMERAAAKALEQHAPLISLGRPNTRLGAGRIETEDENWKALFEKLIAHAQRVIIVPIGQPATMEEIRTIATTPELLEKTVFVLPKDRRNKQFSFTPDESIKSIGGMWDHTREAVKDALPAFPSFAGGARLVTFPAPDEAVEYRGNGICAVQQPSGIKRFLTEGRATTLDWLMLPVLLLAGSIATMNYVDIGMPPPEPSGRSYVQWIAEGNVGRFFLQNVVILPMMLIGIYKMVTGDLPRRIGRPMGGALFLYSIGCIVYSIWLNVVLRGDGAADGLDMPLSDAASLLGSFMNALVGYAAVALILQRDMRKMDLLFILLIALALLSRRYLIPEFEIETRADPRWIATFLLTSTLTCIPLALPLLRTGGQVPRWLALVAPFTAVLFANLVFNFLLWENYIEWVIAGRECEFTYGEEELACYSARAWKQIGWYVLMGVNQMFWIMAMAIGLRHYTGLGLPQRWAEPLPKYDEA